MVLIKTIITKVGMKCFHGFRPLTGIMVLIVSDKSLEICDLKYGFRPLTGIMVLIIDTVYEKYKLPVTVSVPLRGLWFLSITIFFHILIYLKCFRPLTGIMVLIRTPYKWLHRAIKNAFCGADFLFSSFFTFLQKMIFKNRPIAVF